MRKKILTTVAILVLALLGAAGGALAADMMFAASDFAPVIGGIIGAVACPAIVFSSDN